MKEFIFGFYENTITDIQTFITNFQGAAIIILLSIVGAFATYYILMYFFRWINLSFLFEAFFGDLEKHAVALKEPAVENETALQKLKRVWHTPKTEMKKIPNNTDKMIAKGAAYYVFLLGFQKFIKELGITDVEKFLNDLNNYLPSLFIGIVIGFFGVRFSDTIYTGVYHSLKLSSESTAKILAYASKIVVLLFTLLVALKYIKILDDFLLNVIFIGFVTTCSLALGLAFGLGGKDLAKEVLDKIKTPNKNNK